MDTPTIPTEFADAEQYDATLLLGIAGPSGSGKTMSALRIARGLAGPNGVIAVIDTENGRALHYASRFKFKHAHLTAPFSPARYVEMIRKAATFADVIIIDSASHEHEGEGGVLEMQVAEHARMGGKDSSKFASWIRPKAEHKHLELVAEQLNKHMIFCFRAQEKLELYKDDKGKLQTRNRGWQPICTKGFEYRMTAMLVLPPNSEGRPQLDAEARKMPIYLRTLFDEGSQLSEETGAKLLAWSKNEVPKEPDMAPDRWAQAVEFARSEGKQGVAVFAQTCSEDEKAYLRKHIRELATHYPRGDDNGRRTDAAGPTEGPEPEEPGAPGTDIGGDERDPDGAGALS